MREEFQSLDAEALGTAYTPLQNYITGKQPHLEDGLAGLEDLTASEAAEAAVDAMESATESLRARIEGQIKFAYARDARYAGAGRIYLKALGIHKQMRDIYETHKTALQLPE